MSDSLLYIDELKIDNAPFPGFFVMSTAPINVEEGVQENYNTNPQQLLQKMTKYLKEHQEDAEILVLLHGYNTSQSGARWRYERTCEYIRDRYGNHIPKGLLVVGYRWSSETVTKDSSGSAIDKIKFSFLSLPVLISIVWWSSLVLTPLGFLLGGGLKLALYVTVPSVIAIATLLLLRLTNYFRDTFRANHYGVPDFVEFIRQLDNALVERADKEESQEGAVYWQQHRIRLSFVGHSMGAFVVTNAVRILSDVFDRNSIGTIDNRQKCPSPEIGNAFCLGRLILVAPDIPADAIISGRANTLRSSLRRFEEAYLFCNRDDIVLKVASTIANYFSFPSKSRDGGHRLGAVSVSERFLRQKAGKGQKKRFGILNLQDTLAGTADQVNYLDYLFVRRGKPLSIRQTEISKGGRSIAGLFTFIDCSDYAEIVNGKEIGIASDRNVINFIQRVVTGKLDTHGGYIYDERADLSRRMIYGLACLGFKEFLNTIEPDQPNSFASEVNQLKALSQHCSDRKIQVLLATERYEVDLLGKERDREGY